MSYPGLSALLEAIIYLAREPVSLDAIHKALPDVDRRELRAALTDPIERYRGDAHGIEIREVADGFRFNTKPEHHEVLKQFIESANSSDTAFVSGAGNAGCHRVQTIS